jgi:branched-chain amino acid transport system ATP-binding protein
MALVQTSETTFGEADEQSAVARRISSHWPTLLLAIALVLLPAVANSFILDQIVGWSLILGTIALSLMFLAGYGGMVSLAQMSIAGVAGYMIAVFGATSLPKISLFWPWWVAAPIAILIAVAFAALVGALSARTEGIYTIIITLALASAFFYLTLQNWPIFNGFNGFTTIPAPRFFGVNWKDPVPLYYMILFFAALSYAAVIYISRAPFGLALQGVRDNPRRMEAIGYNVTAHRIAAHAFAGSIAAIGGILMVWLNNQISPFTVDVGQIIDLLVIAVVGGLGHPIGAFIGALIYVVLHAFALDALVDVAARIRREEPLVSTIAERMAAAGSGNAIELRGVSRYFGALAALSDVTLSVRPGERRAVLGSNGAGKTTLLNCVTGDFPPSSGTVRFFGEDVTTFPPHERIRRGLRRTYQISLLFARLSVRDNVYLACRGASRGRFSFLRTRASDAIMQSVNDLISLVHLEALADRPVGELTHGQQRQLEIALALAGAPRFILFDEPAAGLSPSERGDLVAILTALPTHIGYIIIEHDMDVALRVVESVTMMHNGRIFKEGSPQEIEADPEVQELYLGASHA